MSSNSGGPSYQGLADHIIAEIRTRDSEIQWFRSALQAIAECGPSNATARTIAREALAEGPVHESRTRITLVEEIRDKARAGYISWPLAEHAARELERLASFELDAQRYRYLRTHRVAIVPNRDPDWPEQMDEEIDSGIADDGAPPGSPEWRPWPIKARGFATAGGGAVIGCERCGLVFTPEQEAAWRKEATRR